MDWAGERGLARLDFGFAHRDSALGAFKAQWGALAVPEHSYVASVRGGARVGAAARASDGADGLAGRAWRRAPLPVTRLAALVAYRYL